MLKLFYTLLILFFTASSGHGQELQRFADFISGAPALTPSADDLTICAHNDGSGWSSYQCAIGDISGEAAGGTPGGADTQIQFNDGDSFGGDSALTWNKASNILVVGTNTLYVNGAAGKVGVGTSTPQDTLQVVGGTVNVTDYKDYLFGTSDTYPKVAFYWKKADGTETGDILFNRGTFQLDYLNGGVAGIDLTTTFENTTETNVYGIQNDNEVVSYDGETTAITKQYGYYGLINVDKDGSGATSVGTAYGVYLEILNSATVTNAYGLYIGDVQGSTSYSIYSANTSPSYFAGDVQVGGQSVCLEDGTNCPAEADPQVGTLTNGKWCTTDGTAVTCTSNTPAVLAGSDTQVQFNDGGSLGADSDFTWNKTTNLMTLTNGSITAGGTGTFSSTLQGLILAVAGSASGTAFTGESDAGLVLYNDYIGAAGNFSQIEFKTRNSASAASVTSKIIGVHVDHTAGAEKGDLVFLNKNNGTFGEMARITNDGKVGIGTSAPSAALSVAGSITATTDVVVNAQSVCLENGTNCPAANVGDADYGDVTVSSSVWSVEDDSHKHSNSGGEKCFTLSAPTADDDNVPFFSPVAAITITGVYCRTQGGTSAGVTISDGTNALEEVVCDADGQADDGSVANASFTANERMEFDTGTVTGTVAWVNVCIRYTLN